MTPIQDPIVRRTLIAEIDHLANLWAAQADEERARHRPTQADLDQAKAIVLNQLGRDIESAV